MLFHGLKKQFKSPFSVATDSHAVGIRESRGFR